MKKFISVILKILKGILITLVGILGLVVVLDLLWIYVPQWKASAKIDDVANYANAVSEIEVRDDATIIGVGEATHGNADFQKIKLDVLQQMVAKNGAKSFSLEVDFGDGIVVNNYIHGGEGTADDALRALSFNIYQTEEVLEMIQWMRSYNDGVSDSKKLSFYGFDMQVPDNSVKLIADFCKENQLSVAEDIEANIDAVYDTLTANASTLENKENYKLIVRAAQCIQMANTYYDEMADDYISMNNMRDAYMAENVTWISEYEKAMGNDTIVIAGHNGHIQKKAQFYDSMGSHLAQKYGKEYFVISTDYYKTNCNINIAGPDNSRANHKFCSADPLAKQAKYYEGAYYLNFDEVDQNSKTYSYISHPMTMGSLGEGYSFIMQITPTTNRVKMTPNELSDAMVFVYDAKPFTLIQ